MDKEDNDIMLIVLLVIARYINDAISERGIVIDIISVALHLPKKRNTTTTTNNNAYATVSVKLSIVFNMLSDVLTMIPSFTSLGSDFCSLGKALSTSFDILTEFAPDCFCTIIIAPFCPLLYVS